MRELWFWNNPPDATGLVAKSLIPISKLWHWHQIRSAIGKPDKLTVPVISVEGINRLGPGKTPTVIALTERLRSQGHKPHVVYGGELPRNTPSRKIDLRRDTAEDAGAEPILLAAFCNCWISGDASDAALRAIKDGADVILFDNGEKINNVCKDLSILVVDAVAGFGNGLMFPAGGLTEWPNEAVNRADFIIAIGSQKVVRKLKDNWPSFERLPKIEATLEPLATGMSWKGQKMLPFTSMGRPAKFFASLQRVGAEIIKTEIIDRQTKLSKPLLKRLEADAFFGGGQMVTTEKDAASIPEEYKFRVLTLPVRLRIRDWGLVDQALGRFGL